MVAALRDVGAFSDDVPARQLPAFQVCSSAHGELFSRPVRSMRDLCISTLSVSARRVRRRGNCGARSALYSLRRSFIFAVSPVVWGGSLLSFSGPNFSLPCVQLDEISTS